VGIDLSQINFLAVGVAALATFFLGALWYEPFFGKAWRSAHGYSEEKLKEMQARRPMPVFFAALLASYVVAGFAVAALVTRMDITSAGAGAVLGLYIWVVVAAISFTAWVSSDKPFLAFQIDAGYQLLYLPLIGAIVGAWR
jgi:hypothetical protein